MTRTAVTTESGVYLLTGLVTGTYKVTFTLSSFKPVAREIEVRTGERLRVDIKLELGGLTDEIKVVAETPLLNTTTASRATIIDSDKVTNTPLNGQNPFMFVFAAPGVLGDSARPSISYRPFDNGGMDGFNVNGGVGGSNRFLLDGASNTNSEGGARQPRLRALARRRPGSARRHEHVRRPVRPHRRRHGERQREERHEPALGHAPRTCTATRA